MPLLSKGLALAAGRLPKVVKPQAHAVLDYAVIGACLLSGVVFWKRNKRATLGSLVCAGATALNVIMTDYPGGKYPVIPYTLHGKIDAGLAGLTAAVPRILDFADEPEARYFGAQALVETVVTGMTNFDYYDQDGAHRSDDTD